ncbi:MAG: response regulator transcription factor [Lachnospiraceae bacterium]|nr:response regulator transcription factor [Lachnospiraceae bacterium]
MNKVLMIEDDEILNGGLCYNLQKRDIVSVPAYTLAEAEKLLAEDSFDLIVLDVNLPDGDGFQFAKDRIAPCGMPFLFLTARDLDDEIIGGYRLGADDYITKPFRVQIVMEKIQAVLRRCSGRRERLRYSFGDLAVDFEKRTVRKNGTLLTLTPTEFALLQCLIQNRGHILTKEVLLEHIWDSKGNFVNEHTLSLNISRLRRKINDGESDYIKTIYGMGYRWVDEER